VHAGNDAVSVIGAADARLAMIEAVRPESNVLKVGESFILIAVVTEGKKKTAREGHLESKRRVAAEGLTVHPVRLYRLAWSVSTVQLVELWYIRGD
jgi:hypothetical protein